MKFTSEDLMKAMGLKVGDRVEVEQGTIKATFEVCKDFTLLRLDNTLTGYELRDILDLDYKILPAPKRVGDLKCGYMGENRVECPCPLKSICETILFNSPMKLYDILEKFKGNKNFDQEVYYLLKDRLDKKVEE